MAPAAWHPLSAQLLVKIGCTCVEKLTGSTTHLLLVHVSPVGQVPVPQVTDPLQPLEIVPQVWLGEHVVMGLHAHALLVQRENAVRFLLWSLT